MRGSDSDIFDIEQDISALQRLRALAGRSFSAFAVNLDYVLRVGERLSETDDRAFHLLEQLVQKANGPSVS